MSATGHTASSSKERQSGEKFYKWTVQIEVDAIWVADGFDLTDERANDMLCSHLSHAYGHELRAKVLKAPDWKEIQREQGYTDAWIAAEAKVRK